MIRLTSALTHYPLWVNPNHITDIGTGECSGDERTCVCLVTDTDRNQPPYFVTESPEEVARKVLEWRLAMADYQDSSGVYRQMMRETLEELVGLHVKKLDAFIKRMEEQNHDAG